MYKFFLKTNKVKWVAVTNYQDNIWYSLLQEMGQKVVEVKSIPNGGVHMWDKLEQTVIVVSEMPSLLFKEYDQSLINEIILCHECGHVYLGHEFPLSVEKVLDIEQRAWNVARVLWKEKKGELPTIWDDVEKICLSTYIFQEAEYKKMEVKPHREVIVRGTSIGVFLGDRGDSNVFLGYQAGVMVDNCIVMVGTYDQCYKFYDRMHKRGIPQRVGFFSTIKLTVAFFKTLFQA